MKSEDPFNWLDYAVKRWPLVIAFVAGVMWLTRLHGLAMANADDLKSLEDSVKPAITTLSEFPYLKEKVDRIDRSQSQMADEQKHMSKVLARIEAKL